MKIVFLYLLLASGAAILCIAAVALRLKSIYTPRFVRMSLLTVFEIVMYAFTLLPLGNRAGSFFAGVFFAGLDWLLILFLNYMIFFIRGGSGGKRTPYLNGIYVAFSTVDTFSLLLNALSFHAFTVTPFYETSGAFYVWQYNFSVPYYIHLAFCYLLVAHFVYVVIKKAVVSVNFYRSKYIESLAAFLALIVLNGIFLISGWKLDASILVYVLMDFSVFVLTFFSIPHHIERGMRLSVAKKTAGCVVCYDYDGRILYLNDDAKLILNSRADIRDKVSEFQRQFIVSYGTSSHYYTWQCEFDHDGKNEIFSFDFNALTDRHGKIVGSYLFFSEKTEEIKRMRIQKYNATHDILTGLFNRKTFFEKAHEILIENPDEKFVLVATDIDNFKLINDLFGRESGDEILRQQAKMIMKADYPKSVKGRIFADKFAMLISRESFNPALAVKNTEFINISINDARFRLKIYLGVYEVANHYENIQNMLDKAALAIRKIHGDYSQTLVYYDSNIMEDLVKTQNIVNSFSPALKKGCFSIFLQSQFDKDKNLRGCEALARWNHPKKGVLLPSDFVKPLENAGLIYKLDSFVWEQAAAILQQWKNKGIDCFISVNISPKDFYYIDVLARFKELLSTYDFDPSKLNLEITETYIMNRNGEEMKVIKALRDLGFCIELDDFGSGYSSLKTLENFEFDVIKLDMEFLKRCDDQKKAETIILSIIKMAKIMNMRVVVEGVEFDSQFEFLSASGGDFFQGYYFSKPISVEEFEEKYFTGGQA